MVSGKIVIQKKLEAHEDNIKKKLQAFERRLIEMSKQLEEKNNKITDLENILKKTSDKLENTKKAKICVIFSQDPRVD